ncbi:MAG: hypothetical protein LAO77_03680 [Acidobacteriia bacterium]|nr:hypothetical protein [Terriglobia bacterium]
MKPALALTFIGCLALSSSPATAQTIQSFEDLPLRVNLGDQVRVEDESGVETTGRLSRLTRDDITILTDGRDTHLTRENVRAVAVRGYSLGRNALIGAGVFAALSAVAVAVHGEAGIGPVGAAPIGAGAGAAIGALIPQMKTIYRAPDNRVSVPAARGAAGAGLLEDLGLRVNLDDRLRVEDQSGSVTTGRLTGLTRDEMAIQTGAGEKKFTRERVRQVAVRRQPLRMATLIGAGAGVALGALTECRGGDTTECPDGLVLLGGLGAGAGAIVGLLVHSTTIVYPEPATRTVVSPVISRGGAGVRFNLRW